MDGSVNEVCMEALPLTLSFSLLRAMDKPTCLSIVVEQVTLNLFGVIKPLQSYITGKTWPQLLQWQYDLRLFRKHILSLGVSRLGALKTSIASFQNPSGMDIRLDFPKGKGHGRVAGEDAWLSGAPGARDALRDLAKPLLGWGRRMEGFFLLIRGREKQDGGQTRPPRTDRPAAGRVSYY